MILSHIAAHLSENLPAGAISLPTRTGETRSDCEIRILGDLMHYHPTCSHSVLDFRRQTHESCEHFTTVLLVPCYSCRPA